VCLGQADFHVKQICLEQRSSGVAFAGQGGVLFVAVDGGFTARMNSRVFKTAWKARATSKVTAFRTASASKPAAWEFAFAAVRPARICPPA
jgi:hypothetical protein